MTDDLQQARLEATARALDPIAWGRYDLLAYAKNPWPSRDLIVEHSLSRARAALAAADAVAKVPPLHRDEVVDRWLAAHDAEVAAKALDEAATERERRHGLPNGTAVWLRARAAEYRKEVRGE